MLTIGANDSRKKAKSVNASGVANPPDFNTNGQPVVDWAEWYRRLWKLKIIYRKDDDR